MAQLLEAQGGGRWWEGALAGAGAGAGAEVAYADWNEKEDRERAGGRGGNAENNGQDTKDKTGARAMRSGSRTVRRHQAGIINEPKVDHVEEEVLAASVDAAGLGAQGAPERGVRELVMRRLAMVEMVLEEAGADDQGSEDAEVEAKWMAECGGAPKRRRALECDVNAPDVDGWTALHEVSRLAPPAGYYTHEAAVKYLSAFCCCPNNRKPLGAESGTDLDLGDVPTCANSAAHTKRRSTSQIQKGEDACCRRGREKVEVTKAGGGREVTGNDEREQEWDCADKNCDAVRYWQIVRRVVSLLLKVGADSGATDALGRDVLTAACHSRNIVAAALILQTIDPARRGQPMRSRVRVRPQLLGNTMSDSAGPAASSDGELAVPVAPNAAATSASVLLAMDMIDSFRRSVVIPLQNLAGEGLTGAALQTDTSAAGVVVTWTWTCSDAGSVAFSKLQSPAAAADGRVPVTVSNTSSSLCAALHLAAAGQGTGNSWWIAAQNAEMGGLFFRVAAQ